MWQQSRGEWGRVLCGLPRFYLSAYVAAGRSPQGGDASASQSGPTYMDWTPHGEALMRVAEAMKGCVLSAQTGGQKHARPEVLEGTSCGSKGRMPPEYESIYPTQAA